MQVHSGGGTVDLKRLVGNTAVVRSDGADVAVRAAYAQALDIDTGMFARCLGEANSIPCCICSSTIVFFNHQQTPPRVCVNTIIKVVQQRGWALSTVAQTLLGCNYTHTVVLCV